MKIALVQLNYHVGNFEGNKNKILNSIKKARDDGASLVVFSELSICGYPPLDLLEKADFINASSTYIQKIARECDPETGVLLGGPELNRNKKGKLLHNAVYFLYQGKIQKVFRKTLLPTYDIFDEYRYFEPNDQFELLSFQGKSIAVTVCEDLWDDQPMETYFSRNQLYTVAPLKELMKLNPDLVINLAASPFSHQKQAVKQSIFTGKATKHKVPVIYCNQVGGQTELIFEGGSLMIDNRGKVIHRMKFFEEDLQVIDLDTMYDFKEKGNNYVLPGRINMVTEALTCGIRDYFQKMGFSKATLGLSGGIDSAVTLVLASQALGPGNVHVLLMPSRFSTEHSIADAIQLCRNLGVEHSIVSIEQIFNQFLNTLNPLFKNLPEDITEENIQSRIRGTLLMAYSNKFGNILLNTSNKSETAVGYGTLYGDMSGGLSVLGDVYKKDVYALARHFNTASEIIPDHILTKPPSAELKPDQKDSDSLPDYELLDEILEGYIEKQLPLSQLIESGFDPQIVEKIIHMVKTNEYKRYQTPPILRISSKAFGAGRRIPIVAKY